MKFAVVMALIDLQNKLLNPCHLRIVFSTTLTTTTLEILWNAASFQPTDCRYEPSLEEVSFNAKDEGSALILHRKPHMPRRRSASKRSA